jgi:pimeloyl-ACP methyl ester carboxylesterase
MKIGMAASQRRAFSRSNIPRGHHMNDQLPEIGFVEIATIEGLRIRFARSGPKEGVPVLLTSPWPESVYAFRDLQSAVGHEHPILALDLPGFGHSESRSDVLSPEAMGDFVIQAAAHFGITRMHAVGPDVGTPTLLFAAAKQPGLFESLIVGGGATNVDLAAGQLKELIASPVGALSEVDGGAIGVDFVRQSASRAIPVSVLEDYRLASAGRRFEDAVNFVRAYRRDLPRLEQMLARIETPVLIIVGRTDPIVPPENGKFIAQRLPRNHYVELNGGHLIWEDAPEAYADEITRWLDGGYRTV